MSAYVKTKYSKMIRIIITPSLNKIDFVSLEVAAFEYQKEFRQYFVVCHFYLHKATLNATFLNIQAIKKP